MKSAQQKKSLLTQPGAPLENPKLDSKEAYMEWVGFEDKRNPGEWRVEANDYENEGAVYVAVFSGPAAKERAKEYASIKNGMEERLSRRLAS